MTRPADETRARILKAAVPLFARHGYAGASVRAIVTRARVNQAAINYHFEGKDGLYQAVLALAFAALTRDVDLDPATLADLPREAALKRFVRAQLRPLAARDDVALYLQIFNWETVHPTPVFKAFLSREAAPFLSLATDLIRRFLPPQASPKTALIGAIWLLGQCSVFVRNREQFAIAGSPLRMVVDERFLDELAELISGWAIGGLARCGEGA
jgi:AcrR family transcriptional regulator